MKARVHALPILLPLVIAILPAAGTTGGRDPLAAEIARWRDYIQRHAESGEDWTQIKQATEPALAAAETALARGYRWLALQKLGAARGYLAAQVYTETQRQATADEAARVETEWNRLGAAMRRDLAAPAPTALSGVEPAALRAIAEAALPQVRAFYESSLEYGRATTPRYGFLYLGLAQAQRDFARFCRTLAAPTGQKKPPVRSLGLELDALESELLAAYRPPASIDKHSDFIVASDALKEARDLDQAGLRYGALARYLLAVQRLTPVRPTPRPPLSSDVLQQRLKQWDARLSQSETDHSIGRLFLEAASADAADAAAGAAPVFATTIVEDVLPRYFAALEPARPSPPRPAPQTTVTLVRWPYT